MPLPPFYELRTAIQDRWPLGLAFLGMLVITVGATLNHPPLFISQLAWQVAALCTTGLMGSIFLFNRPRARSYAVASLFVFGTVRSVDSLMQDRVGWAGTWLVLFGVFTAYLQLQSEAERRARPDAQ